MQENELNDAKELLVKKVEEFNCRNQNANDVLNVINKEIDVARGTLNDLKRECNQYRHQIRFLEKKICNFKNMPSTGRKKLKKFRRFVNRNRGWLCLEECKVGPECDFCVRIFQINYSYSANKNSVVSQTFERLYQIYEDYQVREKWTSYDSNWVKNTNCKCM